MDPQRIDQKKADAMFAAGGIAFVVLTGVLFEGSYIRRLMKDLVADSAGVAVAALTVVWWCLAAWLAARLLRHVSQPMCENEQ